MMSKNARWLSLPGVLYTVIGILYCGQVLSAGDEESVRELQLTECRIKLIDQVVLASDRTGVLKFVEPREGDSIRAQQRVAGLDDDLILAEVAAAEHKATNDIEIRAHQKSSELADVEYEKSQQANREVKNTVPLIELHKLKLAAEKARLEIELAEHELTFNRLERDIKRQELGTYAITTPISGLVTKVYKQRGEAVKQGDPIMEVTSTDRLRVEGWLPLEHAWSVAVGQRVMVRLNVPEIDLPEEQRVFEGKITFVDVSVEPVSRFTKVMADVVNQDGVLRAGLTADMTIRLAGKTSSVARSPAASQATEKSSLATTKPEGSTTFGRLKRPGSSLGSP